MLKFDPRGWVVSIAVFAFAVQVQTGLPTLTHPVKNKQSLHWLVAAVYLSSSLCYLCLGVVVSLWFQASIQETCTLNWVGLVLWTRAS